MAEAHPGERLLLAPREEEKDPTKVETFCFQLVCVCVFFFFGGGAL